MSAEESLREIAFQLCRMNDLQQEQWEWERARDEELKAQDEQDNIRHEHLAQTSSETLGALSRIANTLVPPGKPAALFEMPEPAEPGE